MADSVRPRRHRGRDRRGRGRCAPLTVPGPLTPHGVPRARTRRELFDATVLRVVAAFQARWPEDLTDVEFGVEDVPWVDDEWWPTDVPLATLALGTSRRPTRIVVYRLPILARARRARVATESDFVHAAVAERVGELLGRPAEELG